MFRKGLPVFALASLLGAGCSTTTSAGRTRAKVETAAAKLLISDEQETQLGLQVREQLKQQHVKFLEDPQVVQYVTGVANRITGLASKDRPDVKWQVSVIDDPKTVNAFATPGGFIYVYTGLLAAADNEAELAGVLAHECGHVVARHSARQLVDAYGLEAIAALALGKNPGLASQLGAKVASSGLMLANSRSDEAEADTYGVRYASAAGYDPHGLVSFFQKLQSKEGKTPALLSFLSDHPATAERIAATQRYIADNHLTGSDLGADRLAPIKKHLEQKGGVPANLPK